MNASQRPATGHVGPPAVVRVDPADGSTFVFRDAPVVASLSHPADPESVNGATFQVEARGGGPQAGTVTLSPDGTVVIWVPREPLAAAVEHMVFACGLRDRQGRELLPWSSRFVAGDLALEDLLVLDDPAG